MGALEKDLLLPGVELAETHISWVFLTAHDVFKIKKPVDFGFLDFSTKAKRRAACEAEVLLNRRLADGVYLGVVPVVRSGDGRHHLEGEGEVVDWAVHMRRLPDEERADVRLAEERLGVGELQALAARLARFHEAAPAAEHQGGLDTVRFNVSENFQQTRESIGRYLEGARVEEIESWQRRFLDENEALLEDRLRDGRVRDGHGDLRLEHVYIDDAGSITVIDCIEFNDRFRVADVCADVVFLAMDLASRRRVDLAEQFLGFYARESNDYDLYPLADFYESYRAFVRGKIASFAGKDAEARRYFLLALASERRSLLSPAVVAVCGLIGSGKSTLSERVGAMMSAPVIDADRTRKHLAGLEATAPAREAPFQGIYSPDFTEEVYREVLRRADSVLSSGRPVVLDASFPSRAQRARARDLARRRNVPFFLVECRAPRDALLARLQKREQARGVSDGRIEIFDELSSRWEAVEEASPEHIVVDTTLSLQENEAWLRAKLPAWPKRFTG